MPSPSQYMAAHPGELIQWEYRNLVAYAWTIIFFNGIVAILFYLFPKQRRFPFSVQAWSLMLDVMYYLRELLKWGPYSNIHQMLMWDGSMAACRFLFAWQGFVESAEAICNVYLAFVMYTSIVKKVDMSYSADPRYFRYMVIIFWVYTTIWTLCMSLLPTFKPIRNKNSCKPSDDRYNYAMAAQWGLCILITTYFIAWCLRYIREVWKSITGSSKRGSQEWIYIRFLCIIILQVVPRGMWNYYYTKRRSPPHQVEALHTVTFVFYFLDGVVLLACNRELHNYLKEKYYRYVLRKEYQGTNTNSPPQSGDTEMSTMSTMESPVGSSKSISLSIK